MRPAQGGGFAKKKSRNPAAVRHDAGRQQPGTYPVIYPDRQAMSYTTTAHATILAFAVVVGGHSPPAKPSTQHTTFPHLKARWTRLLQRQALAALEQSHSTRARPARQMGR